MKKTQLISTLLLIAMLAGCGSQGAGNDTTPSADNTDDTTTEAPASNEYPYETGRYDGQTFTFLNAEDELWAGSNHVLDYEEQSGELVQDSVYNRARKAEQQFGITIDVVKTGIFDTTGDMQKHVMANEDVYNAAYVPLKDAMAQAEYVTNLHDIDTLHLTDEWWNQSFIDQATMLGGKLYSTVDYINMMGYTYGNVLYFNKDMYEKNNIDLPYDAVRSGNWTYDKMYENMSKVVNLNGDESFKASMSGTCVYGYAVQHEEGTMTLLDGSGEFLVLKDKDGVPSLRSDVSGFEAAYSKLCSMLSGDGFCVMKNEKELQGAFIFEQGRAMFYQGPLGLAGDAEFRGLDFEFGVIPAPKYEASQSKYYTMASEYTLSLTVPKTVSDTKFTGEVLDYMAYLGLRDVIPDIQTSLCYKGMRDDDSIEMFNTILNTLSLDIGYMFGWTKDMVGKLCGADLLKGNDRFASTFAAQKDKITANIEKTLETMGQ